MSRSIVYFLTQLCYKIIAHLIIWQSILTGESILSSRYLQITVLFTVRLVRNTIKRILDCKCNDHTHAFQNFNYMIIFRGEYFHCIWRRSCPCTKTNHPTPWTLQHVTVTRLLLSRLSCQKTWVVALDVTKTIINQLLVQVGSIFGEK